MTIYTKPIIPKTFFGKGLILAPIGKYKIYLTHHKNRKYISINILRDGGDIDDNIHHIHSIYGCDDNICWGNAYVEIEIIKRNKDWYWTVVYCLDLLEDFEDDTYGELEGIDFQCQAQLGFMDNDEFEIKLMNKVYRYLKTKIRKKQIIIYSIDRHDFLRESYERGLKNDKNKRCRKKQNI